MISRVCFCRMHYYFNKIAALTRKQPTCYTGRTRNRNTPIHYEFTPRSYLSLPVYEKDVWEDLDWCNCSRGRRRKSRSLGIMSYAANVNINTGADSALREDVARERLAIKSQRTCALLKRPFAVRSYDDRIRIATSFR